MEFVQPLKDEKQINTIKKLLKAKNMRDYCLFTIGINSGLRISDLLKLKVNDVMTEKRKIKERISIKEQKTGKTKEFPFGETTKKALKEYLESRENLQLNQYLFPSRKRGTPITRQQAYRVLNEVAKEVGVKEKIGTHTLRKTFGYHTYKQGADITRIQYLLNHSAPSVKLRYIGITKEELNNVYLKLNL